MADITIRKIDETWIHIDADDGIIMGLSEYLSFFANNYKWHPLFKNKVWDGKIRLLNRYTKRCYMGLLPYIEQWAHERSYNIDDATNEFQNELSIVEAEEFIASLNLPYPLRDYQLKYFIDVIRRKKILVISPTASGKSLIIYVVIRWLLKNKSDTKMLLTVPTIALTSQMITDFEEYGWTEAREFCHQVYGGIEKDSTKPIIVSTWQSIYTKPTKWFSQYTAILGDEAHECDAKSLKHIVESSTNAEYRIGMTGTLNGTKVSKYTLEGLFGSVNQTVTTQGLIEKGVLSKFKIKALILKHKSTLIPRKFNYQEEIEFLIGCTARNNYIANLAVSLKGNTLILYRYVDKHGKVLRDIITEKLEGTGRNVYYIDGSTDIEIREQFRKIMETETNAILIASTGTFSRGSNIKNLVNLIIAFPNKAKVRLLQSIGRALRPLPGKEAVLYDIADDLRVGSYENTTLKHYIERLQIYATEKFAYKQYKIQLN